MDIQSIAIIASDVAFWVVLFVIFVAFVGGLLVIKDSDEIMRQQIRTRRVADKARLEWLQSRVTGELTLEQAEELAVLSYWQERNGSRD